MTIKIGDVVFTTSRPDNLEAQLLESTGCSLAEHLAALGTHSTGASLAPLVRPFLPGDPPPLPELGVAIAAALADDRMALLAQVTGLFAPQSAAIAVDVADKPDAAEKRGAK